MLLTPLPCTQLIVSLITIPQPPKVVALAVEKPAKAVTMNQITPILKDVYGLGVVVTSGGGGGFIGGVEVGKMLGTVGVTVGGGVGDGGMNVTSGVGVGNVGSSKMLMAYCSLSAKMA